MMRRFGCSLCGETDTYSDPKDAFMDGWKMGEMGYICPSCMKREKKFNEEAENYKLSTGLFGDRRAK